MKRTLVALFITFNLINFAYGQSKKLNSIGKVEYDKTINTYAIIKKMVGSNISGVTQQVVDEFRKNHAQFFVEKSTLAFDENKTLFTPDNSEGLTTLFGNIPFSEQNNIIYRDLLNSSFIDTRRFYEKKFLIEDSLEHIRWKITNETREVCGYTCRRANAIILDSVYVVAFYTTEIQVSSGPESFGGLPGLILEVALPHDNLIWKASKITLYETLNPKISPPQKGVKISKQEYRNLVMTKFQDLPNRKRARMSLIDFLL